MMLVEAVAGEGGTVAGCSTLGAGVGVSVVVGSSEIGFESDMGSRSVTGLRDSVIKFR